MIANDSRQNGDISRLPALFFATSLLIILGEAWLSQSRLMTIAAMQIYGVVLLLFGAAALVKQWTGRVELSVLFVIGYLMLVLRLRTAWLILPLVLASVLFLRSVDFRGTARRFVDPLTLLLTLLSAGVAAALVLSISHYADFLIMEKLFEGDVHHDTLFHTSVASMLKTYGITSSGLNGLVPLEYHVLSHRTFAALSLLSGIHVLEIYGIAYVALVCPLLICAATWSALRVRGGDTEQPIRFWLILCGIFVTLQLLPLDTFAVWDSYFVSESYSMSLVLLLFALPLLVSGESRFELALSAGLLVLASLSKASVGVIGLALLWSRAIILPGTIGRRKAATVAAGATLAVSYVILSMSAQAAASSPLNPFHYAQVHTKVFRAELIESVATLLSAKLPAPGLLGKTLVAVVLYLLANFLLSWIVLVGRLARSGWRSMSENADSLYTAAAVLIAMVALMFEIIGGWYFINPAMFVSLPFVAVILSRGFKRLPSSAGWAAIVVLVAGTAVVTARSLEPGHGLYLKTRARLTGRTFESNVAALLDLRRKELARPVVFEHSADFPGSGELWTCDQIPFTYPAVTERAWIGVIDPSSDCPYAYYGYPSYFTGEPRTLVRPMIPAGVEVVRTSAP